MHDVLRIVRIRRLETKNCASYSKFRIPRNTFIAELRLRRDAIEAITAPPKVDAVTAVRTIREVETIETTFTRAQIVARDVLAALVVRRWEGRFEPKASKSLFQRGQTFARTEGKLCKSILVFGLRELTIEHAVFGIPQIRAKETILASLAAGQERRIVTTPAVIRKMHPITVLEIHTFVAELAPLCPVAVDHVGPLHSRIRIKGSLAVVAKKRKVAILRPTDL